MRLEFYFSSDRSFIEFLNELYRPHLSALYNSPKFQEKLKSSDMQSAFNISLESGLKAIGETFLFTIS